MDRHMEGQGIVRSRLLLHRITKPSPREDAGRLFHSSERMRVQSAKMNTEERKGQTVAGWTNKTAQETSTLSWDSRSIDRSRDEEDSQQVPQCAAVDKIAQELAYQEGGTFPHILEKLSNHGANTVEVD